VGHLVSVVDPHHYDADPDLTYHPDADPDADPVSDFYLMRIRVRIRLFTLMRIRIWIQNLASKKRLKPLKKCSNRLICHTFWLFICKLMRIRFFTLMRMRILIRILFDADPDFI
jgi:hypothetical protein